MCQQQARVRFPASVWCSWTSWLLSCRRAVKWYFWVSEHSCRDTVRRRRCCLTRETSRHVAYVSACVCCVWAEHSLRTQRMSGLIKDLFFPTLPCSARAASDFPGVKRLWYTPANFISPAKLNGQKSRRVGSADQSKEAKRQSGPRSIDNPLSISALAFIDSQAGDKCAAFIWDKH